MSLITKLETKALGAVTGEVASIGFGRVKLVLFTVLGTAILAAALGLHMYVAGLKAEVAKLEAENSGLVANNKVIQQNMDVLKQNVVTLTSANAQNADTVQQLLAERKQSLDAVTALANSRVADQRQIANLNTRLTTILKDPKNDGLVAPALRETVRDVQNRR